LYSPSSVIDLNGDFSLGMAFIFQWMKTISAFGLMVFCRPTRICIVPWNRDSFAGYVALCHLLARYLADSTPKEKKKELDEHSKGF